MDESSHWKKMEKIRHAACLPSFAVRRVAANAERRQRRMEEFRRQALAWWRRITQKGITR